MHRPKTILYIYLRGGGARIATVYESYIAPGRWFVRLDTVNGPLYTRSSVTKDTIATYGSKAKAIAAAARINQRPVSGIRIRDLATL